MNVKLMNELDGRLQRVQAIVDGREQGDADALLQEILDRAAAIAGTDSPEYGLALRARASVYRVRSQWALAAQEYARAALLLTTDQALIPLVQTYTSLTDLYIKLHEPKNALQAAHAAAALIGRYARDPKRYAPHTRPGEGQADTPALGPTEAVVGNLARNVAEALAEHSTEEGLRVFETLLNSSTLDAAVRLALLLEKTGGAANRGARLEAEASFSEAWELAHESENARALVRTAEWVALGRWALRFGRAGDALAIAQRLETMPPTGNDQDDLRTRYEGLCLESDVRSAGEDRVAAEHALRQRHAFCQSTFGRDAEETIRAEGQLGRFLVREDRPDEAVAMLRHAAAQWVKIQSPPAMEAADALFDFAYCLDRKGHDTEAIQYYAMAYRIDLAVRGQHAPEAILAALNVAETSRVAHDYETAERWFRNALKCEREARGGRTPRAAHALNNLAETLLAAGRADEAAPLAEEGLAIRLEQFGRESKEYTRSEAVVAQIALERNDQARLTEILSAQAASTDGVVQWPIDLAVRLYESMGRDDEAIRTCEQALATLKASENEFSLGLPLREQQLRLHFMLGAIQARREQWNEARRHLFRAFELEAVFVSDESRHRSRRQVELLFDESRRRIPTLLAVLSKAPDTTADDMRAAYTIILQRKSMETRLLRLQKASYVANPLLNVLTPDNPDRLDDVTQEIKALIERLRVAREEWVSALIRRARGDAPSPADLSVIALQDRAELLERNLATYVGEQARDLEILGLTAAIPAIGDGDAIIEYVFAEVPTPRYYAFVVLPDGAIHIRDLGDATPLHQALAQLRSQVIEHQPSPGDASPAWRRRARFLTNRLIRPLLDLIHNVDRLYIAPDSELFTLPFDLLPLEDGCLAIDRWTITHLWHGGEWNGFHAIVGAPAPATKSLVISAPDLTAETSAEAPASWRFSPLPFADKEGNSVAEKLGAELLQGRTATKNALLACTSPEILHIATHSFYIPRHEGPAGGAPPGGPDTLLFRARSTLAEPMERSGIALTGADHELNDPQPASPGILFGSEVLDLDLRGTDMVVLSSCQSGLGDPHPGDGIQGLRRAFRAAGAQTVVSSLWKVPDEATFEFMIDFYDRLLADMPRGQALRDTKLALRKRYNDDPLYWAGFVLDGFDAALFRFRPIRALKFANISGIALSFDAAMKAAARQQWDKALRHLDLVIDSETADADLRAHAAYERAGILRKLGRLDEALSAYDALIHSFGTPIHWSRAAVADRGLTKQLLGNLDGAYYDYTSLLGAAGLSDKDRAWTLVNRSMVLATQGELERAIADCDAVLRNPGSPLDQRLKAQLNRADLLRQTGKYQEAFDDATALVEMPESAGTSSRSKAYLVRALCRLEQRDLPGTVADIRHHLNKGTAASRKARRALAAVESCISRGDVRGAVSRVNRLMASLAGSAS